MNKPVTQKLHVLVEKEVLLRLLPVVAAEFDGNISEFVRIALFNELLRRGLISSSELKILKDR